MLNYNIDAYGEQLPVNFGEDISSATSYTMTLQPQERGDKQDLTGVLGTSDTVFGDEKYLANQFVYYLTTAGQFKSADDTDTEGVAVNQGQIWRKKATAVFASSTKGTKFSEFRVTN